MEERFETYNENFCWQYNIRVNNIEEDLIIAGLTKEETLILRISDFTFQQEDKKHIFKEVKDFIERHEWLGRLSLYPTHFFTARYKGILAGVVIMDMPSAFSKLLGENTKKMERLISRGACVSWSPKNLASKLISFSMNWMVQNTEYRLFTAYSDTEAKELGTIYQACNFYYLGKKSGATYQFKLENGRWVSDRYFRSRSVYKKIAKSNDIKWENEWQNNDLVFFDKMPEDIAQKIKQLSKNYQNSCEKRKIESKHKYAYVLGKNKTETKKLRRLFEERNKTFLYPKERGK
jgi:hypothetical protein